MAVFAAENMGKTKALGKVHFPMGEAIWIPESRVKITGVVLDNNIIPVTGWTSLRFSLRIRRIFQFGGFVSDDSCFQTILGWVYVFRKRL